MPVCVIHDAASVEAAVSTPHGTICDLCAVTKTAPELRALICAPWFPETSRAVVALHYAAVIARSQVARGIAMLRNCTVADAMKSVWAAGGSK